MILPLIGNNGVAAIVSDAFRTARLPHAILIEGSFGLGKHTLARYIAAGAVCCESNPPCGNCRSCHLSDVGSHPDIMTLSPEESKKNITVDAVRRLRNEAYLKPNTADRRVFIIDPADSMNETAQNALLKVLEEPPASAMFILITESAASLLPTVRSRCVLLTLAPVDIKDATEYLCKMPEGYSFEDASDAAELSKGNIGQALAILNGAGGLAQAADEFLNLCSERKTYECLKLLHSFEKNRPQAAQFFVQLKTAIGLKLKEYYYENGLIGISPIKLNAIYDLCLDVERGLAVNSNLSLLFSAFCASISVL